MRSKKHIDDAQPATVEEHFKQLMSDESFINSETGDVTPNDLPDWFDEESFRVGQQYVQRNMLGIGLAALTGLIVVLTIPTTIDILIYTKRSGTPCTAFKRYLETLLHINKLYTEDVNKPDSKWYRSINAIRSKHSTSSRRCSKNGLTAIYQKDMALTQYGFIGFVLCAHEILGMTAEPHEREGFNHVWRVIGHMLDIDDRLNLCRKNVAETTELCEMLRTKTFKNYMLQMRTQTEYMILTMLNGFWYIDVAIDADAILSLTYRMSGIEYKKPLGWYSWLNLKYRDLTLRFCGLPYVGVIPRTYFNYFLRFSYWSLEKWPILAWLAFGKDNAQIQLHTKISK